MNKDTAKQIGLMIRTAREKKGVTQFELARKAGTKQPAISRIETGSLIPTIKVLSNIANALELELTLPEFK